MIQKSKTDTPVGYTHSGFCLKVNKFQFPQVNELKTSCPIPKKKTKMENQLDFGGGEDIDDVVKTLRSLKKTKEALGQITKPHKSIITQYGN